MKRSGQGSQIASKKQKQNSANPVGSDGVSQCFRQVTTSLYISLAPCYINDPIRGIKEQHLDPLIMTYYSRLQGVILSYKDIKLYDSNKSADKNGDAVTVAKITSVSPFAFLWIDVTFLVWSPKTSDIVQGWSFMQTPSHIGLLIHDTFNATIKKSSIPQEWYFVANQADELSGQNDEGFGSKFRSLGHWCDADGVPIEGKLKFRIKNTFISGNVLSVDGSLLEPGLERDTLPVTREKIEQTPELPVSLPVQEEPVNDIEEDEIPGYTKEVEGAVDGDSSDESSDSD